MAFWYYEFMIESVLRQVWEGRSLKDMANSVVERQQSGRYGMRYH